MDSIERLFEDLEHHLSSASSLRHYLSCELEQQGYKSKHIRPNVFRYENEEKGLYYDLPFFESNLSRGDLDDD